MNERLKELLAKHIAPPALAVTRDLENQHTAHVTYTVSQAEMNTLLSAVVQECADIALKKGMASPYTDFRTGSYVINQYLLTHFGVEE